MMRLVDPHTIMFSTPTFGMYSFLGKINKSNTLDVPRLPLSFGIPVFSLFLFSFSFSPTLLYILFKSFYFIFDLFEELDFDAIAARLSHLECASNRVLMFFPSPNNPTGALLPSPLSPFPFPSFFTFPLLFFQVPI
jgi:histidinol-phosphate/aromatic aminotransferase/cobyric acid decarboxylase-like protein